MTAEQQQALFEFLQQEFNVSALETDMREIELILENKWISVEDKLPTKEDGQILIIDSDKEVYVCAFESILWNEAEPTHWKPLPKQPQ